MSKLNKITRHILVCEHKTCLKQGGRETLKALKHALKDAELAKHTMLTKVDCLDQCGKGPVVVIYPDGVWYGSVDERDAERIVEEHLKKSEIVAKNVLHEMRNDER
jgi:sirohydrochlorin cobaltochelatase